MLSFRPKWLKDLRVVATLSWINALGVFVTFVLLMLRTHTVIGVIGYTKMIVDFEKVEAN